MMMESIRHWNKGWPFPLYKEYNQPLFIGYCCVENYQRTGSFKITPSSIMLEIGFA